MDSQTVLMAGLSAAGVVIYAVRQEGRINLIESRYEEIKADIDEIKSDVKSLLLRK